MDIIDVSNLNRQFLFRYECVHFKTDTTFVGTYIILFCLCLTYFRSKDVGRPKADVAAEFIHQRVPGCNVVPYPLK